MAIDDWNQPERGTRQKTAWANAEERQERSSASKRSRSASAVPESLPPVDRKLARKRYDAWMADWQPCTPGEQLCLASAVHYSLASHRRAG
jgi:hypothetical protein